MFPGPEKRNPVAAGNCAGAIPDVVDSGEDCLKLSPGWKLKFNL